MSDVAQDFAYVAVDAAGKRVRGAIKAASDQAAFARLKADGLSPISVRPGRPASGVKARRSDLRDRDVAALASDLAALLRAGADIRSALTILGARSPGSVQGVAREVLRAISGGDGIDQAFARRLGERHAFVAALVAAGEAAGDTAGGLERAAELLEGRIKLRDQLVSVLSYPAFVLATAVSAFLIILILVVPALAPLVESSDVEPGLAMRFMLAASAFLRDNALVLTVLFGAGAFAAAAAGALGLLAGAVDRLLLDGPTRGPVRSMVYGGFAVALGGVLAAGAPMSDALRLSLRAVRSRLAVARLEPVAQAVRQGEALSAALARVPGFPDAIGRLALIGEESGALGPMLVRAGRFEEQAAIRQIEAVGRIAGPALVVLLGGLIGLMMAGLLSGISDLGNAALGS